MSTHPSQEFHIEIQPSIREIGEKEWDRCAGNAPPFLRYAFFSGLEDSGCLNEESGWQPAYLCVKQGDRIIAVCPSFLKYNSEGEFVFDHGWAAAAEQQLGIPYFPKLVLACPFTPATGDKIMIDPLISDHSEIYRAVLAALVQVSRRAGVSSAHLLFSRLPQVASLFSDEFQLRIDLQYHWYNRDYQDMDAFLSEFSSSKRKAIRKERRSVKETGVEIRNLRGHELGEKEIDSLFCFKLCFCTGG